MGYGHYFSPKWYQRKYQIMTSLLLLAFTKSRCSTLWRAMSFMKYIKWPARPAFYRPAMKRGQPQEMPDDIGLILPISSSTCCEASIWSICWNRKRLYSEITTQRCHEAYWRYWKKYFVIMRREDLPMPHGWRYLRWWRHLRAARSITKFVCKVIITEARRKLRRYYR